VQKFDGCPQSAHQGVEGSTGEQAMVVMTTVDSEALAQTIGD
jgi:hypothetical protein